jgi:hypothetical protein
MTTMLAAVLDGRVVVLDSHHARVMLLDPPTERTWRACAGLTVEEIAARVGRTSSEVMRTLQDLNEAGLVSRDDAGPTARKEPRWHQAPVTWI